MAGFSDIILDEKVWKDITTEVGVADGIALIVSNVSIPEQTIVRLETDVTVPSVVPAIDKGIFISKGEDKIGDPAPTEKVWAISENGAARIFVQLSP